MISPDVPTWNARKIFSWALITTVFICCRMEPGSIREGRKAEKEERN
jgi:hypothetical protein